MRLIGNLIGWFCLIVTVIFIVVVVFSPDRKPFKSSENTTAPQEETYVSEVVQND